ncbi:MAG: hypothetical protein HGA85_08105 [Nanoarchaeota archaeon]|nr:hypothetical protein [Nanoarchaeota archaeon]
MVKKKNNSLLGSLTSLVQTATHVVRTSRTTIDGVVNKHITDHDVSDIAISAQLYSMARDPNAVRALIEYADLVAYGKTQKNDTFIPAWYIADSGSLAQAKTDAAILYSTQGQSFQHTYGTDFAYGGRISTNATPQTRARYDLHINGWDIELSYSTLKKITQTDIAKNYRSGTGAINDLRTSVSEFIAAFH